MMTTTTTSSTNERDIEKDTLQNDPLSSKSASITTWKIVALAILSLLTIGGLGCYYFYSENQKNTQLQLDVYCESAKNQETFLRNSLLEAKADSYLGKKSITMAINANDLLAIKILVLLRKENVDIKYAIFLGKKDAALLMIDLGCHNTSFQVDDSVIFSAIKKENMFRRNGQSSTSWLDVIQRLVAKRDDLVLIFENDKSPIQLAKKKVNDEEEYEVLF